MSARLRRHRDGTKTMYESCVCKHNTGREAVVSYNAVIHKIYRVFLKVRTPRHNNGILLFMIPIRFCVCEVGDIGRGEWWMCVDNWALPYFTRIVRIKSVTSFLPGPSHGLIKNIQKGCGSTIQCCGGRVGNIISFVGSTVTADRNVQWELDGSISWLILDIHDSEWLHDSQEWTRWILSSCALWRGTCTAMRGCIRWFETYLERVADVHRCQPKCVEIQISNDFGFLNKAWIDWLPDCLFFRNDSDVNGDVDTGSLYERLDFSVHPRTHLRTHFRLDHRVHIVKGKRKRKRKRKHQR